MFSDSIRNKMDCAITNIANGEINDISILYEELCKPVFTLAFAILRNYYQAEDVMQETFLRVQSNADKYSKGTNPKAWILSITRNISLNMLNKSKKEILLEDNILDKHTAIDLDCIIDLKQALDNLDMDSKQIITMHLSINMKFTEIAEILDMNVNTIRTKYFRALKKLKAYFKGKEG